MTGEDADSTGAAQSWYRRLPWRRIASVLAVIVLLAVVIPFVVYAVPQVVGADHSYVVLSGSMQPTMGPGDVVIVEDVPLTDIAEGDVITFQRPEESRPTTHRVIEVQTQDGQPAFRTAGDSNEDPDPELVGPNQVIGEVASFGGYLLVIPFIGRIIMFSGTQTGFLLLAVLPVALFVLNELWAVIRSTRHRQSPSGDDRSPSTDQAAKNTVEFSAGELRLGIAILVVFLAYSGWVAYATLESWALGTVAAVATATVLLVGIYSFGGPSGSDVSVAMQSKENGEGAEKSGKSADADDPVVLNADGDADRTQPDQSPGRSQGTPVGGDQDD